MSALTIRLSPALSRQVVLLAEKRRKALGWSRSRLAQQANARLGDEVFSTNLLDVWHGKASRGMPQRIDLDKALVLLAVCGHGSNRLDRLVEEIESEVTGLVDEAVSYAAPVAATSTESGERFNVHRTRALQIQAETGLDIHTANRLVNGERS